MRFLGSSSFCLFPIYLFVLLSLSSGVYTQKIKPGKFGKRLSSILGMKENENIVNHNNEIMERCSKNIKENSLAFALPPPLDRVKRDFLALTRRVTARHILIPKKTPMNVILTLKQNIRNKVYTGQDPSGTGANKLNKISADDKMYIEDAFSSAAQKISQDEETAELGGLLGTLVPQGYCRAPELDRACFEVPLGQIAGPIESDYGYHLLLVTERTNCPKLDGGYTRIIRGGENGKLAILATPGAGGRTVQEETAEFALSQVGFWILISLAGGLMAEVAAKAAGVIETLPYEN